MFKVLNVIIVHESKKYSKKEHPALGSNFPELSPPYLNSRSLRSQGAHRIFSCGTPLPNSSQVYQTEIFCNIQQSALPFSLLRVLVCRHVGAGSSPNQITILQCATKLESY
jgi:hypothetical protein